MTVATLVGNPKRRSRTFEAAEIVAQRLTGRPPDARIDLVDFGPKLLDWGDADVAETVARLQATELVVVASPTFKGSLTGLLKLFLDRVGGGAWVGVTAIPLMLGGDWRHSLAPEVFLKPVLAELGASTPTRGLFLLDSEYADSVALTTWLDAAKTQLPPRLLGKSAVTAGTVIDQEHLRRVFSAFPAGVTAVAAVVDGRPVGLAASSFTSVSLEPPLVSVCFAHSSTTWPLLRRSPRLGVSVLGAHQAEAGRRLSARGVDRFATLRWRTTDGGAVFLEGASAWLDCSIAQQIPAGDHDLVLFRVHDLDADHQVPPLVFHARRLQGLHM